MAERCPGCGYRFEREEGFVLGSLTVNTVLTSGVFLVYLVVGFVLTVPDPPILPLTLGAVVVCAVCPLLFYPFAKTTWAAIDLAMRPLEVVEQAEAVTFLAAQRGEPGGAGGGGGGDGGGSRGSSGPGDEGVAGESGGRRAGAGESGGYGDGEGGESGGRGGGEEDVGGES
jgi:Protein of unknown function (DUF983)